MTLYLAEFDSPIGQFHTAASSDKLLMLDLPGRSFDDFRAAAAARFPGATLASGGRIAQWVEMEVHEYLERRRTQFTIPCRLEAPPFHRMVLERVAAIPYGHTLTYGAIARAIGKPGAARAVGAANARNPLPLLIPCHRVVASNGLGGYGGGLAMKRRLLELEGLSLL